MAKSVKFLQHEVDVLLGLSLVRDDRPEEVGEVPQRLVTDHHAPRLHHPALKDKLCKLNRHLSCPCHKIIQIVNMAINFL